MVFHHKLIAGRFEALQVAAMVDELAIYVFIDAGHAEDVPTVIDVEEHVSIKILIVLSVTVSAYYYLCRVDC